MKKISTLNAPQAIGVYSQAIEINNMIFLSGQIGLNPNGEMQQGFEAQLRQVFENIKMILKEADSDITKIVKLTIFLSDLNNFSTLNKMMQEVFNEPFPARSALEVSKLPRNALVEVEAIAYK